MLTDSLAVNYAQPCGLPPSLLQSPLLTQPQLLPDAGASVVVVSAVPVTVSAADLRGAPVDPGHSVAQVTSVGAAAGAVGAAGAAGSAL